jgi:DinB superfamily
MTPFTHPYAEFLGDRNPLDVLGETQQSIPSIAHKLGPDGLKRSYAQGKWTASQVLAHLADTEIAFGFRVRQIISEPQLPIQPFDENLWARRYNAADGLEAASTFQALRGWNLSLFGMLEMGDLEKASIHPVNGPQKAGTVIRVMAGHTLNHVAQLQKIAAS